MDTISIIQIAIGAVIIIANIVFFILILKALRTPKKKEEVQEEPKTTEAPKEEKTPSAEPAVPNVIVINNNVTASPEKGTSSEEGAYTIGEVVADEVKEVEDAIVTDETQLLDTNSVMFTPSQSKSFDEAYAALSDEKKAYFEDLKNYALSKEGAKEHDSKSGVSVKIASHLLIKLGVKKENVVASYLLVNDLLKEYKKRSRKKKNNVKISLKETELVVADEETFATAKELIDLAFKQIGEDQERLKEARRAKSRRPKNENPESEDKAEQAEELAEAPAEKDDTPIDANETSLEETKIPVEAADAIQEGSGIAHTEETPEAESKEEASENQAEGVSSSEETEPASNETTEQSSESATSRE